MLWPIPGSTAGGTAIDVVIHDQSARPIAGVVLQLKSAGSVIATAVTGEDGHASLAAPGPGPYEITATKDGFEPFVKSDLDVSSPVGTSLDLTLVPTLARKESIEVHDTVSGAEQGASPPAQLPVQSAKELPGRPPTVADALPLVPGVVRASGGGLAISGAGEHRSALIVNSADVTDPATGQFGLTVPIDSVQTLNVYQAPYLAEYGRFSGGLVSVETRRGGDKWKWDLNDPFPDFRIRSYHMEGIQDATPRLNVEGPLIAGKLYLSEGFEYVIRKTEVFELPFPYNQKIQTGINSFSQFDWIVSTRQWVTATVHIAPQRLDFVNLNFYNPEVTSPDASTHNYTATIGDHFSVWGGLLDNTFSFTRFIASVWGQGTQDLTMTPTGNSGNYFAQQARNAARASWAPIYSFAPLKRLGVHNFKIGAYAAESSDDGQVSDHPINILDFNSRLLERITYAGGNPFRMSDQDLAFFGQDHWMLSSHLSMDLGVRSESQEISESFRVAPRAGIAWTPFTTPVRCCAWASGSSSIAFR